MKKVIAFILLSVLLATALPGLAFAEDTQTYSIPELHMTVALPESYLVVTRDTIKNPNVEKMVLETYGMNRTEIEDYFSEKGIYLDAIHLDTGSELVLVEEGAVRAMQGTAYMENLAQDLEFAQFNLDYIASPEYEAMMGLDVSDVEFYETNGYLYIRYSLEGELADGRTIAELHYTTIVNNCYINLYNSGIGGIDEVNEPEQKAMMEQIVSSISFERIANPKRTAVQYALIVGGVAAGIIALIFYLVYKKRLRRMREEINRSRAMILEHNRREEIKHIVGRLTLLKQEGIITAEEFADKKNELEQRLR